MKEFLRVKLGRLGRPTNMFNGYVGWVLKHSHVRHLPVAVFIVCCSLGIGLDNRHAGYDDTVYVGVDSAEAMSMTRPCLEVSRNSLGIAV